MNYIAIYTTTNTEAAAWHVADTLLTQNLVACAQVEKIESRYMWDGAIQSTTEYKLLLKTVEAQYTTIERIILSIHPYDVPAIYAVSVTAIEPAFAEWVAKHSNGNQ